MKTNGAAKRAKTKATAVVPSDPWAGVMSMGPRMPLSVVIVLAIVLHAGVAAAAGAAMLFVDISMWGRAVRATVMMHLSQEYEIEVPKPPEPPPPEPPKEEPKEEPKPLVKAPTKDEPPPPPPPAAAPHVLTAPETDKPVDLTDPNAFATSNSTSVIGGPSSGNGTSTAPVKFAAPNGVVGGTGTAPVPAPAPPKPTVDMSRGAKVQNLANLQRCPFPAEADADQIDDASVIVDVKVRPDGTAEAVTIASDPNGHGFGREARKCALRERYTSALDAAGNPIPGTAKIRFHFER